MIRNTFLCLKTQLLAIWNENIKSVKSSFSLECPTYFLHRKRKEVTNLRKGNYSANIIFISCFNILLTIFYLTLFGPLPHILQCTFLGLIPIYAMTWCCFSNLRFKIPNFKITDSRFLLLKISDSQFQAQIQNSQFQNWLIQDSQITPVATHTLTQFV